MDIVDHEMIKIHQEFIRRESGSRLVLKQAGITRPPLADRVIPAIGELLCRVGSRMKERAVKPAAEEASAPTYLIML
jgi:hypothetical protein